MIATALGITTALTSLATSLGLTVAGTSLATAFAVAGWVGAAIIYGGSLHLQERNIKHIS